MSPLKISWKSLWSKPLSSLLNVMLIAFGTGILTILILATTQISDKLNNNSKDIDLVVGAKGSPLQLILSSIYYIDFPTGNIPLKDAQELMRNPYVKRAVPLALGDNYQGTRIVGTDSSFIALYGLKLGAGKFWNGDFETTIGKTVAEVNHLKVGDKFFGAHGLTGNSDIHKAHAYIVTGILELQGNVTDNLILTNIKSVWRMHDPADEHNEEKSTVATKNKSSAAVDINGYHNRSVDEKPAEIQDKEITSLLIQYRSPMSVVMFPRMVNSTTNLQSASPAMESTRLFSLIGIGVDTIQWFAILIMAIAAISVFVNLYNSLKERSYDLAIMRILGASRTKLFIIIILEGIILAVAGSLIGIVLGHAAVALIGHFQDSSQAKLSGTIFLVDECYLFAAGVSIGIIAAVLPSIQAYRANISKTLSQN
ncbi:putative ABC transport system permease protein [Pedobacter sp. UYP24]